MRTVLSLAAALSLLISVPLGAQTANDPHHPDASAPAAAPPANGAPPRGMGTGGMMNGGMMGSGGMMSPGGAMGPTGMMPGGAMGSGMGPGMRVDGAMPMAGMMRMMGAAGDHLDGRLAFLKAELKITDAQVPQWSAFEEAVRGNAKAMADTRRAMMTTGKTLPERLATEEEAVNRHATAIATTKAAVDKLYGVLTPEQKETADTIVLGPMGMPIGMMP